MHISSQCDKVAETNQQVGHLPASCQVKRGRLMQVTAQSGPLVNDIVPIDTLTRPDTQSIVAE